MCPLFGDKHPAEARRCCGGSGSWRRLRISSSTSAVCPGCPPLPLRPAFNHSKPTDKVSQVQLPPAAGARGGNITDRGGGGGGSVHLPARRCFALIVHAECVTPQEKTKQTVASTPCIFMRAGAGAAACSPVQVSSAVIYSRAFHHPANCTSHICARKKNINT